MEAKLIKKSENYYELYEVRTNLTLLIGSTDSEKKIDVYGKDAHKLLSLKNCQEIENGYDLNELAENKWNELSKQLGLSIQDKAMWCGGFKHGLLEILGDKKFSEEDIKNAIEYGIQSVLQAIPGVTSTQSILDAYKQALQPKEWDVEVEMECVMGCQNLILNGENSVCCGDKKPKLDSDGCLIFKRI